MANIYTSRVPRPGLGDAGSYQVAGKPFIQNNTAGGTRKIEFPTVTQWVQIHNNDPAPGGMCVVALSELAVVTPVNSFLVAPADAATGVPTKSDIYNWKISEIWIDNTADVTILAGLTGISTGSINQNWSGSAGVG